MDNQINNYPSNYDEDGGSQYNGYDEYNKNIIGFFLFLLIFISFCSVFSRVFNNDNRRVETRINDNY